MSYTVTQNTSFLTTASVIQKVITFFYFALIARIIGVENTSQYFLAITFSMIFIVIADFGLSSILTRENSRYPEKSEKFLNTVISTKIILGLVTYLLVILIVNLLNYPVITKHLIYLAGVTMFFDNLNSTFYAIFRAHKNLVYESIGLVCSQILTLLIGTVALLKGWPLLFLIAAYTIPSFLNTIYSGYFAKKLFKLHYKLVWDKVILKMFLILAWPFALAGIIGRLYSFSDSLLMSKMLSAKQLGWWSVSFKMSAVFQFIPVALSASIYPVFSSLYIKDKTRINLLFEKSYRYLFFIVFPVTFGVLALAKPFIIILYGKEFLPSVLPLQILIVALIFIFLTFVNGALLNAINKQKVQTGLMAGVLIASVVLNLILLPHLQIVGAAITALITSILLFVAGYLLVDKYIDISFKNIFKRFNQNLWPAVIMGLVVYYLSTQINFLITIPIGAVIYFALLFLTGGLDVDMIRRVGKKVF